MRWPFTNNKKQVEDRAREAIRDLKVLESQQALLEAATSTADAANFVTNRLKTKLEDSMAQLESTARILNDALVICDIDGCIQAFNPAAERMFGMTADQVRETFVGDLFFSASRSFAKPLDADVVWGLLERLDRAEDANELMGCRSSGSKFPLDVNHTRLDRSDGTSIVLLVMRDMTAGENGEHQSVLKGYRSIFESSFDGILVVKDHRIVAANPAATNLFGYNVEELLAQSLDMLGVWLRTGTIDDNEAIDIQIKSIHQDGHPMEMAFTTTSIWWDGAPASLVTIKNVEVSVEDITPNMICCFDANYKITFVNSAFANHYEKSRTDLIGSDIRSLMTTDECNPFLIQINSLTEEDPTRRMQLRSNGPDGQQRLQIWIDHATFEEGIIEYQRIGQNIKTTGNT